MKEPIVLNQKQSEFLRDLVHALEPSYILDFLVDKEVLDDPEISNLLKQLEVM